MLAIFLAWPPLSIGKPVILDDAEMRIVIEKLGGRGSNA